MRLALVATLVLAGFAAVSLDSAPASACGGCFAPPDNPSVVTDHRMVLAISPGQTTLYDQIKYSGAPQSFGWVLPIRGEAQVGLSADVLFASLDGLTQTQVNAPPRNCPSSNCSGRGFPTAGSVSDNGSDPGITVTKHEVVGPYETVQLKATDPSALANWLQKNNYNVPADVQPVIASYVKESFDFLALKLVPGQGIESMRPVRVTTQGASAVLPLRMVAAGTGATVGITLWVVGEGRYEPQNFPSFHIGDDELAWDWAQNKSNYRELRAEKAGKLAGRGWEVESSIPIGKSLLQQYVESGGLGYGVSADASKDYLPVDGPTPVSAEAVRADDLATLFQGVPGYGVRVTRLRSDIAHAALDQDLSLVAPSDQGTLSNIRQAQKSLNGPPACPSTSCGPEGYGLFGGGCSVAQTPPSLAGAGELGLAAVAGLAFIGIGVSRRRRRAA